MIRDTLIEHCHYSSTLASGLCLVAEMHFQGRLSSCISAAPTGRVFLKFNAGKVYKIYIRLKSEKVWHFIGYFTSWLLAKLNRQKELPLSEMLWGWYDSGGGVHIMRQRSMLRCIYNSDSFTYSLFIYSLRSLSCDMSIAFSKASSPRTAMKCFLFQFPVSSHFLKNIQYYIYM